MDNKSSIIGFVIYFWIFQISAFLIILDELLYVYIKVST